MTSVTTESGEVARRDEFSAALVVCPGHEALAILGTKWVTLLLEALVDGPPSGMTADPRLQAGSGS